eukprot:7001738-Prymnesium_polylepis.3
MMGDASTTRRLKEPVVLFDDPVEGCSACRHLNEGRLVPQSLPSSLMRLLPAPRLPMTCPRLPIAILPHRALNELPLTPLELNKPVDLAVMWVCTA